MGPRHRCHTRCSRLLPEGATIVLCRLRSSSCSYSASCQKMYVTSWLHQHWSSTNIVTDFGMSLNLNFFLRYRNLESQNNFIDSLHNFATIWNQNPLFSTVWWVGILALFPDILYVKTICYDNHFRENHHNQTGEHVMRVSISLFMCVLMIVREHSIIQLKIRAHDDLPSVAVVQNFSWRNVKTVGDNFSDSLSIRWRIGL